MSATCQHPNCGGSTSDGKRLCEAHRWRQARGLDMDAPITRRVPVPLGAACSIPGCRRRPVIWWEGERICSSHNTRRQRGMADWRERPMPPFRGQSRQTPGGVNTPNLRVQLSRDEHRRLSVLAEARGIRVSTLAREALRAWLEAARYDGQAKGDFLFDSTAWARRADDAWSET